MTEQTRGRPAGGRWVLALGGDPGDSHLAVTATGGPAAAVRAQVPGLADERFASRLFARDATLWGPDAVAEAGRRLSWVGLGRSSRPLVGQIAVSSDPPGAQVTLVSASGVRSDLPLTDFFPIEVLAGDYATPPIAEAE